MLLCRAEQQRNEALLNAEELTRAFKKFKEKATEKIEKVRDFCFVFAMQAANSSGFSSGSVVGGKVLRELGQGKQLW